MCNVCLGQIYIYLIRFDLKKTLLSDILNHRKDLDNDFGKFGNNYPTRGGVQKSSICNYNRPNVFCGMLAPEFAITIT